MPQPVKCEKAPLERRIMLSRTASGILTDEIRSKRGVRASKVGGRSGLYVFPPVTKAVAGEIRHVCGGLLWNVLGLWQR
jgi:hypothetical protein